MKVELVKGATYRALVNASVGSVLGVQLLRLKLTGFGFEDISIEIGKTCVEVTARYTGPTVTVDLNYDIKAITRVA
jgi:hypothetical protein